MFLRTGLVALFLIASSAVAYSAKLPTKFDGYVTSVASQDQFEMGSRQIEANAKTQRLSVQADRKADTYVDPMVRVGSLLHVEGRIDKHTGEFMARSISFLPEPDWGGNPDDKIEDAGLVEEMPALHREGNGAAGTLWVEGYPLKVTPRTKLLSDDGKAISIDQIRTNTWAFFQGKWLPDHSIEALSIHFSPNTITPDEVKFRDKSKPKVVRQKPGKVKGLFEWTSMSIPNKAVQDYVTKVGESLVPQYQKDLPASDPSKIKFRFYVIRKPSRWKAVINDCMSSADGIVIIPDSVLAVLDNEAQLAALLSNCIAGTLDKQIYVHRGRLKTQAALGLVAYYPLWGLPIGIGDAVAEHKLWLEMNERASRIGLGYMLHAGYDIREAPFAWRVAANKRVKNPWQEGNLPPALTRSIMGDLYFDYGSADYSRLKTGREAYQKMLTELRAAVPKLPKPTNHPEQN